MSIATGGVVDCESDEVKCSCLTENGLAADAIVAV